MLSRRAWQEWRGQVVMPLLWGRRTEQRMLWQHPTSRKVVKQPRARSWIWSGRMQRPSLRRQRSRQRLQSGWVAWPAEAATARRQRLVLQTRHKLLRVRTSAFACSILLLGLSALHCVKKVRFLTHARNGMVQGFDCLSAGAPDVGGAVSDTDAPQPPAPAPPAKRRRLRRAAGAAAALPAAAPSPATGVFADDSSDGEPQPGPLQADMAAGCNLVLQQLIFRSVFNLVQGIRSTAPPEET